MSEIKDLTDQQLRAEVLFWRQNAVCEISREIGLFRAAEAAGDTETMEALNAFGSPLREAQLILNAALAGEYFGDCGICGDQIREGAFVVHFGDIGEAHAICAGVEDDQLKVGGKIPVDPEMIELQEDESRPAQAHMDVTVSEPIYTEARIAALAAEAREIQRQRGWGPSDEELADDAERAALAGLVASYLADQTISVGGALLAIAIERDRQIKVEGWTHHHDDAHDDYSLRHAGNAYLANGTDDGCVDPANIPAGWPWASAAWKPGTPRRDLERAGGLFLAEIEREHRRGEPLDNLLIRALHSTVKALRALPAEG